MKIFEKFEIYGIPQYAENTILASLFLGDPCLLIGRHGTAKTELIKLLGQCLEQYNKSIGKKFQFQIYDASKLNPEDLIGYADINALTGDNPTVKFISSPITIWGKDLVGFDEINRCSPEVQNNLFELIRSRKCSGVPTGTNFIYGTMNPFGDVGTSEMSEALVDRFTFFLHFMDFSTMSVSDRLRIIQRIGDVEGLGIRFWKEEKNKFDVSTLEINEYLSALGKTITDLMKCAGSKYLILQKKYRDFLPELLATLSSEIITNVSTANNKEKNEITISGRRASMMYRGLLSIRAIEEAKVEMFGTPTETFQDFIKETILTTFPVGVAGKMDKDFLTKTRLAINTLVDSKWKELESSITDSSIIEEISSIILNSNDLVRKIKLMCDAKISTIENVELWNHILEQTTETQKKDCIYPILSIINRKTGKIPANVMEQVGQFNPVPVDTSITLRYPLSLFEDPITSLKEKVKGDSLLEYILYSGLTYYNSLEDINTILTAYSTLHALILSFYDPAEVKGLELSKEEKEIFGAL